MPRCLVADGRLSLWWRTCLHCEKSPGVRARGHDRHGWGLRGIERREGSGLLKAIQERFEQLAHGRQGIVIKQCVHPLPQPAFAAQLGPDRLEQRTTELLCLGVCPRIRSAAL